jgi:hypothetical protein
MSVVFSENWKTARQITQATNARGKRELFFAGAISTCGMAGKYPLPRPTKVFYLRYAIYDLRGLSPIERAA